jgi:alkylhydroperoxidase family enzyme
MLEESIEAVGPAPTANITNPLESRPDMIAAWLNLRETFKIGKHLPDRLIELVRLRIAFRNQCRSCMSVRYTAAIDDGLTEELVCSLERPEVAPNMTAAEKAAVAFADQFAVNHLDIAAQRDALAEHFDAVETAELANFIGFFVGMGRVVAVFDDGAPLPVGDFPADGAALAPWGIEQPTVMPLSEADQRSASTFS